MVPGVARGVLRGALQGLWGVFRGPLGVLGESSRVIGGSLGDPRGPKEGLGEPLGSLLELFWD